MPETASSCVTALPSPRTAGTSARFFFNDTATTEIYTLSLHDALPTSPRSKPTSSRTTCSSSTRSTAWRPWSRRFSTPRSEEHTSELQSQSNLVCRLLLEKKKTNTAGRYPHITSKPHHTPL